MLLSLILVSIPFTSCGGDDEDDGPTQSSVIVGTWVGNSIDSETGEPVTYEYEFKANGTFTLKMWLTDLPNNVGTISGTYSYDSNKGMLYAKIIESDGETYDEVVKCTISQNTMTIVGEDETITFTRKK